MKKLECPKCIGLGLTQEDVSIMDSGGSDYGTIKETKECVLCGGKGLVTIERLKAWLVITEENNLDVIRKLDALGFGDSNESSPEEGSDG